MAPEADKEADATAEAAEKTPVPAKGGGKLGILVVIIVGLLVMIVTPLTTWFLIQATSKSPEGAPEQVKRGNEEKPVLDLKAITVNVAETKGTRMLRINPHLVLSDVRLNDLLKNSTAMLVDRVMLAASRKTIDELDGPEGHEGLKREIMAEVNAIVKERFAGAVVDVYFSEFLIQ